MTSQSTIATIPSTAFPTIATLLQYFLATEGQGPFAVHPLDALPGIQDENLEEFEALEDNNSSSKMNPNFVAMSQTMGHYLEIVSTITKDKPTKTALKDLGLFHRCLVQSSKYHLILFSANAEFFVKAHYNADGSNINIDMLKSLEIEFDIPMEEIYELITPPKGTKIPKRISRLAEQLVDTYEEILQNTRNYASNPHGILFIHEIHSLYIPLFQTMINMCFYYGEYVKTLPLIILAAKLMKTNIDSLPASSSTAGVVTSMNIMTSMADTFDELLVSAAKLGKDENLPFMIEWMKEASDALLEHYERIIQFFADLAEGNEELPEQVSYIKQMFMGDITSLGDCVASINKLRESIRKLQEANEL